MIRGRQIHPKPVVSIFASLALVFLAACGRGFAPISQVDYENQLRATGYQAPDGKNHTGASGDSELDRIKDLIAANGIESLSKADRDLATSITSAYTENLAAGAIRIQISFRDSTRLTFEFGDKDIAPKQSGDAGNEVRYKSIGGKNADGTKSGTTSGFEAAMLCRKQVTDIPKIPVQGCQTATVALRETAPNGARAALILRNQSVQVSASSSFKSFKHDTLKRLIGELNVSKPGDLKTFEVAWGPSGFALNFGDSQICPVGRLVETNDLDEPLRLNCAGTPAFRDLEARMIGNTTRGELLLQISAATPGLLWSDTVEHVYLLIRQKSAGKKAQTGTTGTTLSPKTPSVGAPTPETPIQSPTAPQAPADDPDDDDVDDPVFDNPPKAEPKVAVPAVKLPETAGWLIPVNANHAFTKVLANDRRHPIINRGIKNWLNGARLKSFAQNFLPNRAFVTSKLAINQVPAEYALILFGESNFFVIKGYPLSGPFKTSAWGPWQFLDDTGIGNQLRINRRLVNGRYIPGTACDERADLGKSTEAAGRYLRSIINMFPNDPKLVLLGYNQGEFGVKRKVTSLKNTGSQERLAAIKEMGLNYWTIRKFNMASAGGMKYVENFVSVYHAALESDPVAADPSVEPWKPNPQCSL